VGIGTVLRGLLLLVGIGTRRLDSESGEWRRADARDDGRTPRTPHVSRYNSDDEPLPDPDGGHLAPKQPVTAVATSRFS
jgi:hypothetical protein